MVDYRIADRKKDMEYLMSSRFEMLRHVNQLPSDYEFSEEFVQQTRKYFESTEQTTVLAMDGTVIGCATMCYIQIMPTFSHPTGKRAHLMNVYTNENYRRQGIGLHMLDMLMKIAKEKGVTEVSLDATDQGRPLYRKYGFVESDECMVFVFS